MIHIITAASNNENDLKQLIETFEALIRRVPKSEEEAEWIVLNVEKMIVEHPSLSMYLEPDSKEEEEIHLELQEFY